jgi:hypothetical protein
MAEGGGGRIDHRGERADGQLSGEERGEGVDAVAAGAAAGAVGRLLARAARETTDPHEADRLWDVAIGLLDRLCDVGGERSPPSQAWAARLEQVFEPRGARGLMTGAVRL